jgi:hypothetical protein
MLRDEAVGRINDGLGFRQAGHSLTDKIIARLIEAQRDLEHGKTLPRFLLLEDEILLLPAGEHQVALPERFLRLDDDNLLHYPATNLAVSYPTYLKPLSYSDAVKWHGVTTGSSSLAPNLPGAFVLRKDTIDFIATAQGDIEFVWSYYRGSMTLETNVTNHWLTHTPEWLIGEAGHRIAMDARDATAIQIFDDLRQKGRAAAFADILLDELAGGPMIMGRNL